MEIIKDTLLCVLGLVAAYVIVRLVSTAYFRSKFQEGRKDRVDTLEEALNNQLEKEQKCQKSNQGESVSKRD